MMVFARRFWIGGAGAAAAAGSTILLAVLAACLVRCPAAREPARPGAAAEGGLETVILDGGEPAAGARISVSGGDVFVERAADSGGRARFHLLPPGSYEVEAVVPGGRTAVRRIDWPGEISIPLIVEVAPVAGK